MVGMPPLQIVNKITGVMHMTLPSGIGPRTMQTPSNNRSVYT